MTKPPVPMTPEAIDTILDACRFGDHLTVTRTNGDGKTSVVSGPVLCAPDVSRAVGIDLLDGEPHVLRREDGITFGRIVSIEMYPPFQGVHLLAAMAEAWDEGHYMSELGWRHVYDGHDCEEGEMCPTCCQSNPYRTRKDRP